jgi:predicted nucleic acid-binding protein
VGAETLVDTGFIVALLDADEQRHGACVEELESRVGALVTTEAVLTESLYLLSDSAPAQDACLDYFLRGAIFMIPTALESLSRVRALMRRYRSVPMDYADATLVVLAETLETGSILTLDRRGFTVFRWKERRPFAIAP